MRYDHCRYRGLSSGRSPPAAFVTGGSAHVARWKPLPAGLDPAVVRLVVQLRRYKDDSRLTLPRLAAKTAVSTSSWERYLGGRALPPRPAVEALTTIAGGDLARVTALYDAAAEAWREQSGSVAAQGEPGDSVEKDRPEPAAESSEPSEASELSRPSLMAKSFDVLSSRRSLQTALTLAVGAVLGAAITLAVVPVHAAAKAGANGSLTLTKRVTYTCTYTQRNGQWYAGNSTTSTDLLEVDMWGSEVAELQCLLQRAKISPGGIDGSFGPLTEAAVIKEQKARHLDVDGQVGPQTWAALRK